MSISKKTVFTAMIITLMIVLPNVAAVTTTIPASYSDKVPIGQKLTYNIERASGKVDFVFFDPITWSLISNTSVMFEQGGKIEVIILGFDSFNVSLINISVYLKDGTKNASFSNVSMNDIAFQFIFNIGMFAPGFLCINNWTLVKETVIAIANQPPEQMFSMNGTLNIAENDKEITIDYKQNPTKGNQNTTMTFSKETGVLQSAQAAFGNYFISIKINSGFAIDGYNTLALFATSAIAAVLIIRKKKLI